ncbi:MAG: FAD-dependent oxidoreductase [Bacteroidetes bacterium]|jgi:monoamine oxidase|nr:FAD-dependent oxidoreductase [Bacteroidota bacterium]
MEPETDIIIIGAGICGLSAGEALARQGKRVMIMEARSRTGGRVNTLSWHYSQKVEAGAEFIHGDLPLTKALVKKAGGTVREEKGEFYSSGKGSVYHAKDLVPHMKKVLRAFHNVKEDITLTEFLKTHFTSEADRETRERIIRQAEGFDAADPYRISIVALREEWGGDSMESTSLITEGYSILTEHLTEECMKAGCLIYLSKEAKEVQWQENRVRVLTEDGSFCEAGKLLVTVPLGVLIADSGEKGVIRFVPEIPDRLEAARQMGYGPVIKIVLEFKTRFWKDEAYREKCAQIPALGFLMNESEIPMFWANDAELPLITGWVGGSSARKLMHLSDEELHEIAVEALAEALVCRRELIMEQLNANAVFNWGKDPFAKGAYSYRTPETPAAKKLLNEPVQNTLYFAGEALGDSMGTVEAALESAAYVVKKMSDQ